MLSFTMTISDALLCGEWILDSNCSYHICPKKDLFATYQEIDNDNLLTRNCIPSNTVDVGTVKTPYVKNYEMLGMFPDQEP